MEQIATPLNQAFIGVENVRKEGKGQTLWPSPSPKVTLSELLPHFSQVPGDIHEVRENQSLVLSDDGPIILIWVAVGGAVASPAMTSLILPIPG
jgi:hypothetical protein